jgi:hypothetical protein
MEEIPPSSVLMGNSSVASDSYFYYFRPFRVVGQTVMCEKTNLRFGVLCFAQRTLQTLRTAVNYVCNQIDTKFVEIGGN